MKTRCTWVGNDPLMTTYHDTEWGVPQHNDDILFEYLILDSAQAGLSWSTILKKRENYRKALHNFNPHKIAQYSDEDIQHLLRNPGIIRNKLKVNSHIKNARAFLAIQNEFGTFNDYLWQFVNNKPIQNNFKQLSELPAKTEISETISKDLKSHGMTFVGPTIIYAMMQAAGLVNDHVISCFRHKEVQI